MPRGHPCPYHERLHVSILVHHCTLAGNVRFQIGTTNSTTCSARVVLPRYSLTSRWTAKRRLCCTTCSLQVQSAGVCGHHAVTPAIRSCHSSTSTSTLPDQISASHLSDCPNPLYCTLSRLLPRSTGELGYPSGASVHYSWMCWALQLQSS